MRPLLLPSLPARSALAVGVLLAGCGDDQNTETPVDEPRVTLIEVRGAGAGGFRREDSERCVELGRDRDQTLVARVRITGDWLLRPYAACGNNVRCGYVEVEASDDAGRTWSGRAAATTVNVPLGELEVGAAGVSLTITARLLTGGGAEYQLGDGGLACESPEDCSLNATLQRFCDGELPDGGAPLPDASQGDAAPVLDGAPDGAEPTSDGAPDAAGSDSGDAGSDAAMPSRDGSVPDASGIDAGS